MIARGGANRPDLFPDAFEPIPIFGELCGIIFQSELHCTDLK